MSTTSAQSEVIIIDAEASLLPSLDSITNLPTDPPSLYIDLEGIALERNGCISILSLYIAPTKKTYLIDIYSLEKATFSITTEGGTSLKSILESPTIPKGVFDIRNDSDALFSHFQISVDGIKDLQLMELAVRKGSRKFVSSLAKCIEKDSPISAAMKTEWRLAKETGRRLFAPEKGGSYEVFNERPLKPEIIQYCKQDVALLPGLYGVYQAKLRSPEQTFWRVRIRGDTKRRIKESQSLNYNGNSTDKALGWDDDSLEEARESWNDDILMEARIGDYILDENDNWVAAPKLEEMDYWDEEPDDHWDEGPEDYQDDPYEDTARDCIGWEEDMMKNGEFF